MDKLELKFLADGIISELNNLQSALSSIESVRSAIYDDEFNAIIKCRDVLQKISNKCKSEM